MYNLPTHSHVRADHVLKNVFVGMHDLLADLSVAITPDIRSILLAQANDGIDFVKQRSAFIALAKGICEDCLLCTAVFFTTFETPGQRSFHLYYTTHST